MKQNKNEIRKYINIPLSIIDQKWFGSDKAVRAWFFMARQALGVQTKTIKNKDFQLTQGELICTRSYLSEALGINDSSAKGCTDRLKRSGAISVKQEQVSGSKSAAWNKVSRIAVKGVPVPSEAYVKMYFPVAENEFWEEPVLAQLYTYMVCTAFHENSCIVGTNHTAKQVSRGDVLLSYKKVLKCLKCKEWQLKTVLCILENTGSITRMGRVGNKGVLIHLNDYPEQHAKKVQKNTESKEIANQQQSLPSRVFSTTASSVSIPVVEKTANPCNEAVKKQEIAILDTDVTEAISYLFFDLKKNKDIDRLNQIIEYVDSNMPANFPVEKLKDAMDYYFSEYGDAYIDRKNLIKAIVDFNGLLAESTNSRNDKNLLIQELERKIDYATNEYSRYQDNWNLVGKNFKVDADGKSCVNDLEPETIDLIYHTIWYANLKCSFVDKELLTRSSQRERPSMWKEETCTKASYIENFFERIGNVDALRKVCQTSIGKRYDEYMSDYTKFMQKVEELKKAI